MNEVPLSKIVSDNDITCLVGGASIDPAQLEAVSPFVCKYIAVDGGADHLLSQQRIPLCVIGDLDSLSEHARATFADRLCHVPDQDTTDFEKAVTQVSAKAFIALGFTGGRIDHSLAVLSALATRQLTHVLLVDSVDVSFLAQQGRSTFALPIGSRISMMPLDQATVSVTGVTWPFADQLMRPTGFVSPSNAVSEDVVKIDVDGSLLITLPRAQLATALQSIVPAE